MESKVKLSTIQKVYQEEQTENVNISEKDRCK